MAPSADTPMVAQDAATLLWREWVDGKRREEAAYDSVALKLESRMARAAVLSQRHGQVNSLRTAVAFDCLDQLGKVFGRYGTVFRTIRAELEKSIYVDGQRLLGSSTLRPPRDGSDSWTRRAAPRSAAWSGRSRPRPRPRAARPRGPLRSEADVL